MNPVYKKLTSQIWSLRLSACTWFAASILLQCNLDVHHCPKSFNCGSESWSKSLACWLQILNMVSRSPDFRLNTLSTCGSFCSHTMEHLGLKAISSLFFNTKFSIPGSKRESSALTEHPKWQQRSLETIKGLKLRLLKLRLQSWERLCGIRMPVFEGYIPSPVSSCWLQLHKDLTALCWMACRFCQCGRSISILPEAHCLGCLVVFSLLGDWLRFHWRKTLNRIARKDVRADIILARGSRTLLVEKWPSWLAVLSYSLGLLFRVLLKTFKVREW